MKRLLGYFFAMALSSISLWNIASAQDGALDNTFGFLGRQTFSFPDGGTFVFASRELADGRLVIAGHCATTTCLARLQPNGSFDPTFGPSGLGYVRFPQLTGAPAVAVSGVDMAVLPDGRMAILGIADNDLYVFMVRTDGTALDTSNGGSGYIAVLSAAYPLNSCGCRIVSQPDGKLLTLASVNDNTIPGVVMAVSRVLPNITGLDSSFGSAGLQTIVFSVQGPAGQTNDDAAAIALQADGKILIGGQGLLSNNAYALEFARLLTNGQRDTTFGSHADGRFVLSDPSHSRSITSIVVDAQQRLMFGGIVENGSDYAVTVGRLTTNGLLDTSFDSTGLYEFQPIGTSGTQSIQSLAVTSDSIFATSQVPRESGDIYTYLAVTRLGLHGIPASGFGSNGTVYYPFVSNSLYDMPVSLLLTSQGIVIAGNTETQTDGPLVGVARLQYQHIFGDGFE
jgi:uncharacterized delta-60 repeat protein